jgi:hypothetical protein
LSMFQLLDCRGSGLHHRQLELAQTVGLPTSAFHHPLGIHRDTFTRKAEMYDIFVGRKKMSDNSYLLNK